MKEQINNKELQTIISYPRLFHQEGIFNPLIWTDEDMLDVIEQAWNLSSMQWNNETVTEETRPKLDLELARILLKKIENKKISK